MQDTVRWACPDGGPAKTDKLVEWAVANLIAEPVIMVNPRDLPALRATILADRIQLAAKGIVQPGTVWLEA